MSNTRKATPKPPAAPKVRLLRAVVTAQLVEVDGDGELTEMPPFEVTVAGKDWQSWAPLAFTPEALAGYREQFLAALAKQQQAER